MMLNLEKSSSSRVALFPKNLFTLCWYRITEDYGFGDLLFWSKVHDDEQNEVVLVA
jgi:hypothetical protein